jgi:hypothetical protein
LAELHVEVLQDHGVDDLTLCLEICEAGARGCVYKAICIVPDSFFELETNACGESERSDALPSEQRSATYEAPVLAVAVGLRGAVDEASVVYPVAAWGEREGCRADCGSGVRGHLGYPVDAGGEWYWAVPWEEADRARGIRLLGVITTGRVLHKIVIDVTEERG